MQRFGVAIASSLGPIAFDQLALSLGARGMRANTPTEIVRGLRQGIDQPVVTVVHVPITGGNP
jgi:thiamine pyrophosphate-dependent acetolactate synthase large subunit-like protein